MNLQVRIEGKLGGAVVVIDHRGGGTYADARRVRCRRLG